MLSHIQNDRRFFDISWQLSFQSTYIAHVHAIGMKNSEIFLIWCLDELSKTSRTWLVVISRSYGVSFVFQTLRPPVGTAALAASLSEVDWAPAVQSARRPRGWCPPGHGAGWRDSKQKQGEDRGGIWKLHGNCSCRCSPKIIKRFWSYL